MLKSFSNYKKALLIGIGGGADIIGTIPTKLFLESYGIKCITFFTKIFSGTRKGICNTRKKY